jgi:hypothetical protein
MLVLTGQHFGHHSWQGGDDYQNHATFGTTHAYTPSYPIHTFLLVNI